jgi:hypothetical protein
VQAAAFRVVQEALTNIRRHAADATEISVGLRCEDHRLTVTVADDGRGGTQLPAAACGRGFGLVGLTERVTTPGGMLYAGPRVSHFGLVSTALYMLMYSEPTRATSAAFKAGMEILMGRIRRLTAGGWLRVDEELAATFIHAAGARRGAHLLVPARRPVQSGPVDRSAGVNGRRCNQPGAGRAGRGPGQRRRAVRAALPE